VHSLPNHPQQHFLPTSLRASIIASGYWVLSLSVTGLSGSVASFIGCLAGCYLVDGLIHRRPLQQVRTIVLVGACLLLIIAGGLAARWLTASNWLASMLTPIGSYNTAEAVQWLLVCGGVTIIMRTLAQRTTFGSFLEIVFVAAAFVITLAAHRNGMIHRPYFVGDFALMRGIDPASILMAMGCGAVLSLAALLMIEHNHRRLPYHFAVLGLLCFSLLLYVQFFGLPTPSYTDDLGLTGQEQSRGQDDNPFKDGENNAESLQAPVAIVLFRDDYEPISGSYYFRETAYSQWNGQLLDETLRSDMDQDLAGHFTNSRIELTEQVLGQGERKLVRTSIGMLTPHRTPFGLDSPVAFESTPNPNNLRFKRTYDVESMVPEFSFDDLLGRSIGSALWSPDIWQEYLKLPDDPRYEQLATELLQGLRPEFRDDPFARAYAIKSYLDENGIYSLKNEHAFAQDPAASFLFGDLTGYCMHFAFAATYLYRSIGIPARVGIGYSVPASNRAGGSALLVQAIHGHAWPEVYFEDLGWVIIDPAPRQTLVDMTTDPQNGLQQMLGDMLRNDAAFEEFLDAQSSSGIPLQLILNALYSMVAGALVVGYLVKAYRTLIVQFAGNTNIYRLSYRANLDRLAAMGFRRRIGESRESFARRVGNISPSFKHLTDNHLQCALGRVNPHPLATAEWREMSHKVRDELRSNIPLWKRLLATLNPYPWLLVR
jgi:transglutaminase-like putative cysteine protease